MVMMMMMMGWVHTRRNQDLDEDDHSGDTAGDCSVGFVSKYSISPHHCHLFIVALQCSNKKDPTDSKLASQRHLKTKYLHLSVSRDPSIEE